MPTPPQESIPDVHSHTIPLATTQTALSSPGRAPLAEDTSKPSVPMPVLDAAQTSPPRPTSSSSYHATLISKPVPEVPREYITEDVPTPAEVLPRVESPTFHAPPTSVSAHEGKYATSKIGARHTVVPNIRRNHSRAAARICTTWRSVSSFK